MDIYLKYQVLKDDYDFVCKENKRMHNLIVNQQRQINNLKKKVRDGAK